MVRIYSNYFIHLTLKMLIKIIREFKKMKMDGNKEIISEVLHFFLS